MAFRDYREQSRSKWGTDEDTGSISRDQLQLGCLIRIADAADQLNRQITSLLNERDRHKARAEQL